MTTVKRSPDESDSDYIERVIQQELASMQEISVSSLKKLRLKLLLKFHPDHYEDDTRYVDSINDKLNKDTYRNYMSMIPTVPTIVAVDLGSSLTDALSRLLPAASAFSPVELPFSPPAAEPPSADPPTIEPIVQWKPNSDIDVYSLGTWVRRSVRQQIGCKVFLSGDDSCDVSQTRAHIACNLALDSKKRGTNFCCEQAAGHAGECTLILSSRKRVRSGVAFDAELRVPLIHSLVKIVSDKVFSIRGIQAGNVKLYAKHLRLILQNEHPLCRHLPPFNNEQYVSNLFVVWSTGFDAWSASVPPIDKRGNDVDSKGNGHAALHAIYDLTEHKMQRLFNEAIFMVM